MFTKEDGPTALRADLLRGLSFSSRPEDVQVDDHSGSAVAAVSSVWNGSRGFVAVLIRFIEPPHVDRYMYSEPLTDESMLALAQAEAVRFAKAMGFRMDDPRFQELDEATRAKRLLNWNLIRKVRLPTAPETPLAVVEDCPPASPTPAAGPAIDEEALVLEPLDVCLDGNSTERLGSPIVPEPVPEPLEAPEEITLDSLFSDVDTAPAAPASFAPLPEPEPLDSAADEPMVIEPMRERPWEAEEGTAESEPLMLEPANTEAPIEAVEPVGAAGAEEAIPLESVVLEPDDDESDDDENDDTPVALDFANEAAPAALELTDDAAVGPDDAGMAPPFSEPNVFDFNETPDAVDVEPGAEDRPALNGETMLEFSDEDTIEADIEEKGGFGAAGHHQPGAVLGKVELIRREGGDRRQLSSLGRLLSFF